MFSAPSSFYRRLLAPLFGASLLLNAANLTAAGLDPAESFAEIALKNEHGPNGWMPVRKWVDPIAIFLDSRVGDAALQKRLVNSHIRRLSLITAHPITLVDSASEANLYLLFERESRVRGALDELVPELSFSQSFLNKSLCFGTIHLGADQRIDRALVVIPVDRARYKGRLNSCVIEELTQVMGLVNDSVRVFPSIFNDRSIDQDLSALDIQLLELLYHPRIQPGMSRDEAMPLIRQLVQDQPLP